MIHAGLKQLENLPISDLIDYSQNSVRYPIWAQRFVSSWPSNCLGYFFTLYLSMILHRNWISIILNIREVCLWWWWKEGFLQDLCFLLKGYCRPC